MTADTDMLRVIRDDGTPDPDLEPKLDDKTLKEFYATMVLGRTLDNRMLSLQRQGRIGFYVPSTGQEGCQLGSASALAAGDWVFPAYREVTAALWRGFTLRKLIAQFFGNSEDISKGRQMPNHYGDKSVNFVSASSPVGTQIPQAVGAAWAMRLRNESKVALVYFGDGATSQGDFHVGMNFAGVFKAPCIFFCQNNNWAISVPFEKQTASKTIRVKAEAYGFPGVRVDGNDVLACHAATAGAVKRARSGEGPTLVEAVTYRMGPHSSSDDPSRYRKGEEVESWKLRDPIERFRLYLEKRGTWTQTWQEELTAKYDREITDTVKAVELAPPPTFEEVFTDVYAEMPSHLKAQLEQFLLSGERRRPDETSKFPL